MPLMMLPERPQEKLRDGQTSPYRPRLVVSRSTCPPLSPSPTGGNSFVIGTAVINTHAAGSTESQGPKPWGSHHQSLDSYFSQGRWCSTPPPEQLCNRYCNNKHTHTHPKGGPIWWEQSDEPDEVEKILVQITSNFFCRKNTHAFLSEKSETRICARQLLVNLKRASKSHYFKNPALTVLLVLQY